MKNSGVIGAAIALALAATATAATAGDYLRKSNGDILFSDYPREALEKGQEGRVGIKVRLDREGRLMTCEVEETSGYAALDAASCDFLIAHARMKPFLNADGRRIEKEASGRVLWVLPPDRAARLSKPPAEDPAVRLAAVAREKLICRGQPKKDSFYIRERICLTASEWKRQIMFAQEETHAMQMPQGNSAFSY